MARRRDPGEFIERFSALKRRFSTVAAQVYAKAELGTTQAKFLRTIGMSSPISQAELARATDTDPTLTGRALQTLIERGWVRRERSAEDRREYVLDLSPAGKRACERVEKLRGDLHERIVAQLDDRDLDDFDRIAERIMASLDATEA